MDTLPKTGLYLSTKKAKGMKLYVENAYGDEPNEFYLVELIDEASRNDPSALGDELDKEQWESLVNEYGLIYQG